MSKKNLHPEFYNAQIFCDNNFIFEVGSTKKVLKVDIWLENHPFFTGSKNVLDSEGRIKKFEKKYKN